MLRPKNFYKISHTSIDDVWITVVGTSTVTDEVYAECINKNRLIFKFDWASGMYSIHTEKNGKCEDVLKGLTIHRKVLITKEFFCSCIMSYMQILKLNDEI